MAILGGSGYAGGEFLRLALGHPGLKVEQVTSRSWQGMPVTLVHPNLRGVTDLRFTAPDELDESDVLVTALPHGRLAGEFERVRDRAPYVVDLSADFRLRDPAAYRRHYGHEHPAPAELDSFVSAVPELYRQRLGGAGRIAGAGCIATATILALLPVARAGLYQEGRDIIVEAKIGSSAAGSDAGASSHHPERAGAVRTYAVTRHRHVAEVEQALPELPPVHLTGTAVERVRGVLVTAHVFVKAGTTEADVRQALHDSYEREPFVRLVRARRGIHRVPDPKILDGSNYCDVGFELDEGGGRLVMMAALDNLVKGTAGHAMQALNLALGFDERCGLGFTGLHP
ncbi:MAG TPA: N-acetyl-gamma-glutamyl-phosphate reductase [Trueperaceae bacterium]|nr:N-acetyl-gamma-glutamyl-phosphate reductase [Trueperaceae bacterium]